MAHICGGQLKDIDQLLSTELRGLQPDRITDKMMKNIKRMIPGLEDAPSSSHVLNRNGLIKIYIDSIPPQLNARHMVSHCESSFPQETKHFKVTDQCCMCDGLLMKPVQHRGTSSKICFHFELICSGRGSQGPACPLKFFFDWHINCVGKWHCITIDR